MSVINQEYCDLNNALNWIAFRKDSNNLDAEYLYKHKSELDDAAKKLIFYIQHKKIEVLGQKKKRVIGPVFPGRYNNSQILEPEAPIDHIGTKANLKCSDNTIIDIAIVYKNIKVNCADLLSNYPAQPSVETTHDDSFYKSEYMQIMISVIKAEEITATNPSKTEVLKDIITKEMAKAGLPESAKLAGAMATLIRPANAQGGRKKRG